VKTWFQAFAFRFNLYRYTVAMKAVEEVSKEAEQSRKRLLEGAAKLSPEDLAVAIRATAGFMQKEIVAVRALHAESEGRRAALEGDLAATQEQLSKLRVAAKIRAAAGVEGRQRLLLLSGGGGGEIAPPVVAPQVAAPPVAPHRIALSSHGSTLTDQEAMDIEQTILDAAIDIPPNAFTPAQFADMGYSDQASSLSQIFGQGGASSTVMGPEGIEDLVKKSLDYLAATYGVRATYGEMTYDPDKDVDEDGVDDLEKYDDNTIILVCSTENVDPDVAGLSTGEDIPRGAYAGLMYECANKGGELRTDGQPTGTPVTFAQQIRTDSTEAAAEAVVGPLYKLNPVDPRA
jgi:hypothetical protein